MLFARFRVSYSPASLWVSRLRSYEWFACFPVSYFPAFLWVICLLSCELFACFPMSYSPALLWVIRLLPYESFACFPASYSPAFLWVICLLPVSYSPAFLWVIRLLSCELFACFLVSYSPSFLRVIRLLSWELFVCFPAIMASTPPRFYCRHCGSILWENIKVICLTVTVWAALRTKIFFARCAIKKPQLESLLLILEKHLIPRVESNRIKKLKCSIRSKKRVSTYFFKVIFCIEMIFLNFRNLVSITHESEQWVLQTQIFSYTFTK